MTHLEPSGSEPIVVEPSEAPPASTLAATTTTGRNWVSQAIKGLLGLSFLGLVAVGFVVVRSKSWRGEDPTLRLPKYSVAKADMSTTLSAFGRVESSKNTVISCEIERLEMWTEGRSVSSGGASTILTLVDEGIEVKKGDVLCQLDGSDYEELVRTQEIKTLQASAALSQARLNYEVAEISVKEYREGLFHQQMQSMNGQIILAQSDYERAVDRLRWTEEMLVKGYLPVAKKSEAVQTLDQCQFDLESYQFDLNNYIQFKNPRQLVELDAEVEKRRFEVIANTQRVARYNERLAHYKKMLDRCTIRAPHDGFVIYAVDPNRPGALPIEPGQTVRQSQKLFFLPDLANMQVLAYLHESVASRVHEGMRARSRIEGLSNRELEGHVISVAPLPTTAGNWISDEVKYFVAIVKLDSAPKGMRPGMTAEIQFDVDRCLDVLVVPSEAIAYDHEGHNICYVAGVDGLERRPVTLGRSTRDLLEVTKGLSEGEQVVLRPEKVEAIDSMVIHTDRENTSESTTTSDQATSGTPPVTVD